jgi:hypothetical protein
VLRLFPVVPEAAPFGPGYPGFKRRLSPCHTIRMTEGPDGDLTAAISAELAACRKRGIERIDVRSHNQVPVPTPELQRLAGEYLLAAGRSVKGRIAQIKYLLRDAIKALSAENEPDAELITDLFFGDSQHHVTKSASELLDTARRQYDFGSELRFRQAWHNAFDDFAEFLLRFVATAQPATGAETLAETTADSMPYNHDSVLAPEVQPQAATFGYVDNGEHFITLLSQADKVTIVGLTNESLASILRAALDRKREAIFRSDECWSSVRVVFLTDELLDRVNDERGFVDPGQARLQRQLLGVFGRRTVRVFLKSLPSRSVWVMYDLPYLPPLIGTLFEMPGGRRIVQLIIRRQLGNAGDHLYVEFEDTRGQYFSAAFDEIVGSSVDDNRVAPVGAVIGERFRVRETRYRWSVLKDGSRAKGWLAMVLVVTWRVRDGRAEPLLQLRTRLNSTREQNRLTHLAGHITHVDPPVRGTEFGLEDAVPLAAARKRVQMETGEVDTGELVPLTTGVYYHSDKEHLIFFVYSCRLPDGLELWPQAEMSPVSVPELLSIRKNQVLRNALSLCENPPASRPVRTNAFEIVALNLILHDLADIAQQLRDAAAARTANLGAVAAELGRLEEQTRQTWPGYEEDAELDGLSGLQLREFYAILLPFYETIGVHGAAEELALIGEDEIKRAALDRLSRLYRDERVMRSIQVEL